MMGRTPSCTKMGLKRGPWTPEEDARLVNYIKAHGEGGWRTLAKKAGLLRCGKSCRLRWMNYLRPDVKRGNILPEEEDLILKLHRLLGNRWALIAGRIPGRTDNEIKNYWHTHLSKKLIDQGIDPRTHRPLSESEDIWWTTGDGEVTPTPPRQEHVNHESKNANSVDQNLQELAANEDDPLPIDHNHNVNDRNMNEIPASTSEHIKNNFLGMPLNDSDHQISSPPSCPEKLMLLSMKSNCDMTSTLSNSGIKSKPSLLSYNPRNAALEMALLCATADTIHTSVGEAVNNNYWGFDQVTQSTFSTCTPVTPLGASCYGDANPDMLSWFLESFTNEELNVSEPHTKDAAHHNKQFGSNQLSSQNPNYELLYPSAQ